MLRKTSKYEIFPNDGVQICGAALKAVPVQAGRQHHNVIKSKTPLPRRTACRSRYDRL